MWQPSVVAWVAMNNHTPHERPFDFGTVDPETDPRNRYAMRMAHYIPDPFQRQAFHELHVITHERFHDVCRTATTDEFFKAFDDMADANDALWAEFSVAL